MQVNSLLNLSLKSQPVNIRSIMQSHHVAGIPALKECHKAWDISYSAMDCRLHTMLTWKSCSTSEGRLLGTAGCRGTLRAGRRSRGKEAVAAGALHQTRCLEYRAYRCAKSFSETSWVSSNTSVQVKSFENL